jgi:hypothetical protein
MFEMANHGNSSELYWQQHMSVFMSIKYNALVNTYISIKDCKLTMQGKKFMHRETACGAEACQSPYNWYWSKPYCMQVL